MATQPIPRELDQAQIVVEKLATIPNLRVLAWNGDSLYASRGYSLLAANPRHDINAWHMVGRLSPTWWRRLTSRNRLSFRLVRDGFHALAVSRTGNIVAAVPGAIVLLRRGTAEFEPSHRITRGTRPLHITAVPDGRLFWGEYFDNPRRDEVHIYGSDNGGITWHVAHTFPPRTIRHIHNIVYDRWENCLWILTGDYGPECKIIRSSLDFSAMEEVLAGNQQARAVAAIVTEGGLLFASDTPLEANYISHLDRRGTIRQLREVSSSAIYSCKNRNGIFFSTMVEPSRVNLGRHVELLASANGDNWKVVASWHKDRLPMKFFQYGNAFLPDGENGTEFLAASTIGVQGADLQTTIWCTSLR